VPGAERRRAVLFAVVCAALLGSAFAFAAGGHDSGLGEREAESRPAPAPERPSAGVARAALRAQRLAEELRRSARRFLVAFLRYEVGESGPGVAVALRATSTRRFAARLLGAPPRAPAAGGFPPPAKLRKLQVAFLSAAATRALISALARRGGRPEELSFLFDRSAAGWRASGPGQ
jgi:hypothetical protein